MLKFGGGGVCVTFCVPGWLAWLPDDGYIISPHTEKNRECEREKETAVQ